MSMPRSRSNSNLLVTHREDLDIDYSCGPIGGGSFAFVFKCKYKGTDLVLKELISISDGCKHLFLKEARLLAQLSHENIVAFDSICETRSKARPVQKMGILLELVEFSSTVDGEEFTVSSLQEYLVFLNTQCKFRGFEENHNVIARGMCNGLAFLHESNVVHMDLKPANVLLGHDRHDGSIVAKLTDFGESRSQLIQTFSTESSVKSNPERGTLVYNAPELIARDNHEPASLQDQKFRDLWSYGMIIYEMINPNVDHPYLDDLRKCSVKISNTEEVREVLRNWFSKQQLPSFNPAYSNLRKTVWRRLMAVYRLCAVFDPPCRPAFHECSSDQATILSVLNGRRDDDLHAVKVQGSDKRYTYGRGSASSENLVQLPIETVSINGIGKLALIRRDLYIDDNFLAILVSASIINFTQMDRVKAYTNPEQKMDKLMSFLGEKEFDTIQTALVGALVQTQQQHLADALMNDAITPAHLDSIGMGIPERTAIEINFAFIINELIVNEELLTVLQQEGILTQNMYEIIEDNVTSSSKASNLIRILRKRGPRAFQIFLNALTETHQDHIAQVLSKHTKQSPSVQRNNCSKHATPVSGWPSEEQLNILLENHIKVSPKNQSPKQTAGRRKKSKSNLGF